MKFVNTDLALTFVGDADSFRDFVKSNGLKVPGKSQVADLIAGKRDEVGGFYLVADEPAEAPAEVAAEPVVEAPVVDAPAPVVVDEKLAGDAAFSGDAVDAAVAAALASGAPVTTSRPAPAAAPARAKSDKKLLRSVTPVGKVKPVRKGTKIANGLELLLAGCKGGDLVAAGCCDDLVDFCNRRVTKRGYGIALDGEMIRLVLPAGAASVAYSG